MSRRDLRVGIFDADAPGALAFTRSLGRAGVPLRVYSTRRWPLARFSRFCSEWAPCPSLDDPAAFQEFLAAELRGGRIDLVAPTSDLVAFHAAELHDAFAPRVRDRLPSPGSVVACLFKDRFDAACARAGFRTPWSASPRSVEEARDSAGAFRYPAILKPKSHVGIGLYFRGCLVRNADELRRAFRPYSGPPGQAVLFERHPELLLPMVQEYVPGALDKLFSISGVLGNDGTPIAVAASRKVAQWPPTLGIGIEFEAVRDDVLLARGAELSAAVLGRGVFELEVIRDRRNGDLLAIDLNPRAHGFVSFDVARGNDLPLLWYRLAAGEDVAIQPKPRDDVAWTHGVPHAVWRCAGALQGDPPRRPNAARTVDIVHDARDPLPSAPFVAMMLRHPGGLLRPFLNRGKDALEDRGDAGAFAEPPLSPG